MRGHLERLRAAGFQLPGDPAVLATAFNALLEGFCQACLTEGGHPDVRTLSDEEAADTITGVLRHGLLGTLAPDLAACSADSSSRTPSRTVGLFEPSIVVSCFVGLVEQADDLERRGGRNHREPYDAPSAATVGAPCRGVRTAKCAPRPQAAVRTIASFNGSPLVDERFGDVARSSLRQLEVARKDLAGRLAGSASVAARAMHGLPSPPRRPASWFGASIIWLATVCGSDCALRVREATYIDPDLPRQGRRRADVRVPPLAPVRAALWR